MSGGLERADASLATDHSLRPARAKARRVFYCPKPKRNSRMLQEPITRDGTLRRWEDYVVPQCWEAFTSEDHRVWDLLFARQIDLLGSRVISPFFDGVDLLRLSHPGVPELSELNQI